MVKLEDIIVVKKILAPLLLALLSFEVCAEIYEQPKIFVKLEHPIFDLSEDDFIDIVERMHTTLETEFDEGIWSKEEANTIALKAGEAKTKRRESKGDIQGTGFVYQISGE